nr:hypothetical protein [uncultured Bacteroides sp.]
MQEKKKLKKHTDADRLRYMHLIEDGISITAIHKKYGISDRLLLTLWHKYQEFGPTSIKKGNKFKVNSYIKKQIVRDIEDNHITLHAASQKYGPSISAIETWLKIARRDGIQTLDIVRKRGRPPGMSRPRKNSKPLTELEKLQKENLELKTEIALLKKVRALVEERNARLREIGRKPSKN